MDEPTSCHWNPISISTLKNEDLMGELKEELSRCFFSIIYPRSCNSHMQQATAELRTYTAFYPWWAKVVRVCTERTDLFLASAGEEDGRLYYRTG